MAVYTVHEPPSRGGMASAEPERFVFVRDGFAFWALLFGPLWMLRHRMWLVLLCYVAVVAALSAIVHLRGPAAVASVVWTLLALLVGFEAGTLRRFTLRRRGFSNIGVVVGDDLELAERRFFDAWVRQDRFRRSTSSESTARGQPSGPSGAPQGPHPDSHVLGLFPEPGASL
jgi:Protein of unknown function (DUF2628)